MAGTCIALSLLPAEARSRLCTFMRRVAVRTRVLNKRISAVRRRIKHFNSLVGAVLANRGVPIQNARYEGSHVDGARPD